MSPRKRTVTTPLGTVIERTDLERQIADLAEQERSALGRELHDTLGQQVTAIALMARALQQKLERRGEPEAVDAVRLTQSAEEMKRQVRALIEGLTPFPMKAGGLIDTLQDLVARVEATHDLACRLEHDEDVCVPDSSAIHLFRIAQEAVHNAVKHAEASRVTLELRRREGRVLLRVQDDGRGVRGDPFAAPGMGLRIMRHRAALIGATFELETGKQRGVTITCTLPVE